MTFVFILLLFEDDTWLWLAAQGLGLQCWLLYQSIFLDKLNINYISFHCILSYIFYIIVWKKDSFISNSGTLLVFLSASIFYMCVLNFYFFLSERGILFQTLHKYIRILYICVLNYYICICNQEIELFLLKFNQDDVREGKYYSKVQSTNWLLLTHDNTAIWNKKYTHIWKWKLIIGWGKWLI